ncbi:sensor histidine kinase [Christensenella intestinihominis]|uniref:sensor histidine kinase n=1 Tax=Christensenella intestinihominis TaxID=1851429 RepID=UPI0008366F58|nr:HAMP domain-containing sensor histidine kinase [Christensenella intestinihominis]
MKKPSRRFSLWKMAGGFLVTLLLVLLCIVPAYFLCTAVFSAVGSPPLLAGLVIVTTIGVALAFALLRLFGILARHKHHPGGRHMPKPNFLDEVFGALDRIAAGDFDVLIDQDASNPYNEHYNEMVSRINSMAQGLKSMEQLRQDFVSNVSHEIQSPLTSIGGYAALLHDETLPEEKRNHYLDIIEAESKRLSGLSDNLLKLSALDADRAPFDPRPFRLDKQLEEILLLLEPQWSAKEIELNVDLQALTISGDRDLLSQVWINLLNNAIKFSHRGGTISVCLRSADGGAQCTIRDNGIGIPEADLPRIFERFYKVDKARDRKAGGNGLGLSIVKKIVGLHGGTIKAESTAGQGAAFTVSIPG